jgi:predicted NUDIX family phosphoesterase
VLRALAENDSGWKQIIPQVAVVCGDRVLFHDIPDTAGETRLSGKSTYFIGGHMDDQETDILAALAREMHEEIGGLPDAVLKSMELFHLGFVNDESSDVGAVHFGVVFVAKFKPEHADTILPELRTSEDGGVAGLRWATIEELESAKLRMTNWALMTFPEVRRFVRHGIREGHVA